MPPRSVGALEHDEVVDPRLLELDRHAEAGEAGADDGDLEVLAARHQNELYKSCQVVKRPARSYLVRTMRRSRKIRDPLLDKILLSEAQPVDAASEKILAAAVNQAEEFGLRRFTIDDVARRVGVSRVTIYRYFPRKDQLVEAVLMRELRKFLRDIDEAVAPYGTLEERLVEGFVLALTSLREHRLLNRLLRTEPELLLPHLTLRAGVCSPRRASSSPASLTARPTTAGCR